MTPPSLSIVGGGLVGSLLSVMLAKKGIHVDLFERRPDPRKNSLGGGRSINLVVTLRGLSALERVGLKEEVLAQTVPLKGRMMHSKELKLTFQRYGRDDSECIYSISRSGLNKFLLDAAENSGAVRTHFQHNLQNLEMTDDGVLLHFLDESQPKEVTFPTPRVIGTDGSASAVRKTLTQNSEYSCTEEPLTYGYKELAILPTATGGFKMEREALHIWPRGKFMLIALPNQDGSFTCTLFLPFSKNESCPYSFEQLDTPTAIQSFFEEEFSDAVPLIDQLTSSFLKNPTGRLVTVRSIPWHASGKALMIGDAAHAIVPFFGQGMNLGFEDCSFLYDHIDQDSSSGWESLFSLVTEKRKPNADAIADMALENFIEMRDHVGSPQFLLKKEIEHRLEKKYPDRYRSRYTTVMFTHIPYATAKERGVIQAEILNEVCQGASSPDEVDLESLIQRMESRLPSLKDIRS